MLWVENNITHLNMSIQRIEGNLKMLWVENNITHLNTSIQINKCVVENNITHLNISIQT